MTEFSTLNPKQKCFVSALLVAPSITAACETCHIGRTTAYRYLADAGVKSVLDETYSAALRLSSHLAATASHTAITSLLSILDGENEARDKVSAARCILDYVLKIHNELVLGDRVSRLEQLIGGFDAI